MRTKAILISLACVAAAGCNATTRQTDTPMTLDEVKAVLLAQRSVIWRDPDSIRDAKLGSVYYQCRDGSSCVCLAANARNAMGGYTGLQQKVAVFNRGSLEHVRDWDFGDQCQGLVDWPEFNGGYVAPKAPAAKPKKRSS